MDFALDFARRVDARVDVLNVWELPINVLPDWIVNAPGEAPQTITGLVRGRAALQLETFVNELRMRYDNVHGRLLPGDPGPQIVELATRDKYDLIVMGTHGRTGLAHLWTGSVAESVVRRASCPVLTLRGPEKKHE